MLLADVARQLNVAHVLEGSVRKSGDRLRITAQLIDARTDTHLWSDSFDRELGDIFAIQEEIAAAVVEQMKLQLLAGAPRVPTVDPQAYTLMLQARHFGNLGSADGHAETIRLLEEALAIDPGYAAAWVALSARSVEFNPHGLSGIASNPLFAGIHEDPRWLPFLESVGLAPAQLDAIEFDVKGPW